MHLTFALIVCHFLSTVSAEPANHRLTWRRSLRKREDHVSEPNSTVAINSTQPRLQPTDSLSSVSSNSIVALPLLPSSNPALSSPLPPPPLGTAPVSLQPSTVLRVNSTTPSSTDFSPAALSLGTGTPQQAAATNNGTGPLGSGGLHPTTGSPGTLPVFDRDNGTDAAPNATSTAAGRPPLVTGTGNFSIGSAKGWNSTRINNNTCGGCVVNAQAGLDWWYSMNVYQAIASISTIQLNGTSSFSLVPAQTSVNVTESILQNGATFIFTETFDPTQNSSVGDFIFTTLPPPAAASTSVTTISDVVSPPAGTFGTDVLGQLYTDPGVPTFAIPAATGTPYIASQTTNVVYYTAYEVETQQPSTNAQGQVFCQTSTATYQLPAPFPYEFDGTDLGLSPTETGSVLAEFLPMIPQSSCAPGTWTASAPVMIVVVEVTYQRGFSVFIVHHEVSASSFDAPTVTSDAGSEATGSGADSGGGASINVVKVVASVENTLLTVSQTVTGNPASVPITVGTNVVVASVIGGGSSTAEPAGPVASVIVSALGGQPSASSGGGLLNLILSALGGGSSTPTSGSGSSGGSGAGVAFASAGDSGSPGSGGNSGAPAVTPLPALNIGGQVVTANAGGSFIVQGQTLTQGGQIVIGTNTISLAQGASSLVVNGQTITSPATLATVTPVLSIDGSTFVAGNGAPSFIIGGQTLTPGGVVTANGNTISLGSGASSTIAVVNGVTENLISIITPAAINVGGTAFTELPGGSFVIQGQTLRPGQSITVAGTTLSLGPGASVIVINGQTSTIALGTIPAVIIGGITYAATSAASGAYVIDGQTLTAGGTIVVNGHTISLSPGETALVIDGSTSFLKTPASITSPPLLTFEGHTFTGNSGNTFVINGQTLTPGGKITVDGHTISLSPGATAVVIDGKTTTLFPATKTPNSVSATASKTTTTTSSRAPTQAAATTTKRKGSALPSMQIDFVTTFAAIFVAFLGTLCVGM